MNFKKIIFLISIVLILGVLIFLIFFNKQEAKISKIGNNSSSQEIVDYILNITSYQAKIQVEIQSNKNTNKYVIKQEYKENESNMQEILEPSNMSGIKIIKNENALTLENTKLQISSIFENYKYIADNVLDLNSFIDKYKNNSDSKYEEKENQIIMSTINDDNKYTKYRTLYIDANTGNPIKMEIKDNNKNTTIYIIYNEISINI